jgi:hypothetical protein
MVRIVSSKRLTHVSFVASVERYAEIRASLPELKKELPSKWRATRLDLRIDNPTYVPTQAEMHVIVETAKNVAEIAKDFATVGGLAYATWRFLKKRFPWIKKPKPKTAKKAKPRKRLREK